MYGIEEIIKSIDWDEYKRKKEEGSLENIIKNAFDKKEEVIEENFKKEAYISFLEDFIELTCALCPNEEELIKNKGDYLLKEIRKI